MAPGALWGEDPERSANLSDEQYIREPRIHEKWIRRGWARK